jgi:hypothetical protein
VEVFLLNLKRSLGHFCFFTISARAFSINYSWSFAASISALIFTAILTTTDAAK